MQSLESFRVAKCGKCVARQWKLQRPLYFGSPNAAKRSRTEALQYVSESTCRVWRFYMAACALEFEQGDIGVYEVLATKRSVELADVPLTRGDLYQ